MPAGLADQLSAAGLIDGATGSLRSGAAAASAAGGRIAEAVGADRLPCRSDGLGGDPLNCGITVAVLVGRRGGRGWSCLVRSWPFGEDTVAQVPPPSMTRTTPGTVGMAPTDLTVGGMDLANQINASVGSIRERASRHHRCRIGQAALPKIKEATAQLNEVSSRATQLSPEGKSTPRKADRGRDPHDQPDV